MQTTKHFSEEITETVMAWPGVSAGVGSRGEWAYKVGGRELGHLHGDHVAHFAFPEALWGQLRAQGRVSEHPIFPGRPGWGERRISDASDVADVLALLGLNYERAVSRPGAATGSTRSATIRTPRGELS